MSVTMCAAYAPLAHQASGATLTATGLSLEAASRSTRLTSTSGTEADAAAIAGLVTGCRRVAALAGVLSGSEADRLGADIGVWLEARDHL